MSSPRESVLNVLVSVSKSRLTPNRHRISTVDAVSSYIYISCSLSGRPDGSNHVPYIVQLFLRYVVSTAGELVCVLPTHVIFSPSM